MPSIETFGAVTLDAPDDILPPELQQQKRYNQVRKLFVSSFEKIKLPTGISIDGEAHLQDTLWDGGANSAMLIQGEYDRATKNGSLTAVLYDFYNEKHTVPVEAAIVLALHISNQYADMLELKQSAMRNISAATSLAEMDQAVDTYKTNLNI